MVDAFKKTQQASDAAKAVAEYHAEQAAIDAKTQRLRALRLARDAGLAGAPMKLKPAKKLNPKK